MTGSGPPPGRRALRASAGALLCLSLALLWPYAALDGYYAHACTQPGEHHGFALLMLLLPVLLLPASALLWPVLAAALHLVLRPARRLARAGAVGALALPILFALGWLLAWLLSARTSCLLY
ncbi:hypothetical protein [Vulcaniibacterium tengchongense]|uniref:Uncharacterized protein n=1 Tax=Vulcaniibacterium tengchongense TaxID=1273429 RepID=A0A3N4VDT7_9GAMM|nr:hypothetical protein [Vulcaniibacterium tengchongense]RPE79655.1 hypothetical protein EDC50_1478 [Vulcaniibacterium tengchongense]